jgi:hypothetical protein
MSCGWEASHVGADLGQDDLSGPPVHAWDRHQQLQQWRERGDLPGDLA